MNKLLVAAFAATTIIFGAAPVFAAPSADAGAVAQAGANSASGASANSGISAPLTADSASSISAPLTSSSGATVAGGFSPSSNLTIEPGRAVANAAIPLQTSLVSPQIFNSTNPQANANGVSYEFGLIEACQDQHSILSIDTTHADGASKKTSIIWNSFDPAVNAKGRADNPRGARFDFKGGAIPGTCAGVMTIATKVGDADAMDFAAVMGDAKKFVDSHLRSSTGFVLVMSTRPISAATAMDSRSRGFGGSGSLAGLAGPALNAVSGAIGAATSNGSTSAFTRIGNTIAVIIPDTIYPEQPSKKTVDLDKTVAYYPSPNQVSPDASVIVEGSSAEKHAASSH